MRLPDARGWTAIAIFAAFIFVFTVRSLAGLQHDETTNAILTGLSNAGVLLVVSYYFGASKKDEPPA